MANSGIGENRLLKQLSADDRTRIESHLKKFEMEAGTELFRPGDKIEHVYFPLGGMVSLLAVMQTGEQIETAIVGREGAVGISPNGKTYVGQATVQISGPALRLERSRFLELYESSASFRMAANRFQNVILRQTQQSVACHALHSVEARLCRWLLQSQDITGSDTIPLTQEFLSHMLGVQRSSVSLSAHALQNAGLIKYARGKIVILDREGLRESACECYQAIHQIYDHE